MHIKTLQIKAYTSSPQNTETVHQWVANQAEVFGLTSK